MEGCSYAESSGTDTHSKLPSMDKEVPGSSPSSALSDYLTLARELQACCRLMAKVKGVQKLEKRIGTEIKFFQSLSRKDAATQAAQLQSSNLGHFAAIVHAATHLPGVTRVMRPFPSPDRRHSLEVDVVAHQGRSWVKVVARKGQALHLMWAGQGQFGEKDMMQQLKEYQEVSRHHPVLFATPRLHALFYNGLTHPMASALQAQGVRVLGRLMPVEPEVLRMLDGVRLDDDDDDDNDSDDDDDDDDGDDDSSDVVVEDDDDDDHDDLVCDGDGDEIVDNDDRDGDKDDDDDLVCDGAVVVGDLDRRACGAETGDFPLPCNSDNRVEDLTLEKTILGSDHGESIADTSGKHFTAAGPRSDRIQTHSALEATDLETDSSAQEVGGGEEARAGSFPRASETSPSSIFMQTGESGCRIEENLGCPLSSSSSPSSSFWRLSPSSQLCMEGILVSCPDLTLLVDPQDEKAKKDVKAAKENSSSSSISSSRGRRDGCGMVDEVVGLGEGGEVGEGLALRGGGGVRMERVNLDISTLITLVSAVCHGDGCRYRFTEKVLDQQAEEERRRPTLPDLAAFLQDKEWVVCRTALSDFNSIVQLLGGPGEQQRATQLLNRLTVVDDQPSPRASSLDLRGKIKARSKLVFGTGDQMQAVTVTANSGFIRAAESQNVIFAVHMHPARALTELKQLTATPL